VSASLPSAAFGKVRLSANSLSTECWTLGTERHSAKEALGKGPSAAVPKLTVVSLCRVSGKVYFYFLDFVSQTFCGMFLHYVYLHVSFVENYNRVLNR
jgi:hypothetical protein